MFENSVRSGEEDCGEETKIEENVERRGVKDKVGVVEEKVVLVEEEVLVKMGEEGNEKKGEDVEDGTGVESIGSFITRSRSSSSDSLSVTALPVTGAHSLALALASSTVIFPTECTVYLRLVELKYKI